jgi:6-phospho-beta-glucosidase
MAGSAQATPVAILGGGTFAVRLCEVLATWPAMPALELRLHARDGDRLARISGHAAARVAVLGPPGVAHRVRGCAALDDALDGAAAVVLLIRVGGMAARDHDERFPAAFGLVGDEGVGVGGMANAWRTLPVLEAIAGRIAACAPGAHVLNLMAPLGVTTRLLVERGHRAVGLCELPAVTLARWTAAAEGGAAPVLRYAGLNHLGFWWSPGQPALAHPVLRAAVATGEVTAEVVARYDAAPLHYVLDVFEVAAARALGRSKTPGRARQLAELHTRLLERFTDQPGAVVPELAQRPTPWFEHAVAPALHAALGGPVFRAPLDLPNAGRLDEVAADVVVELVGSYGGGHATLDPVPARPPAVRALLARLAAAEDALYRAALHRDRRLLGDALAALPLSLRAADAAAILHGMCESIDPEVPA